MRKVPELHRTQVVEMHGLADRLGRVVRRWNALLAFGEHSLAITKINFNQKRLARRLQVLNEALNIDARMGKHILRPGKYVLNEASWDNSKRNFPVDAAEGQIIDLVTERRNIGPFRGIHRDRENIVSVPIQVGREFERKWSVSPFVLSQLMSIDPHRRSGHDAFEIHENVLALRLRGNFEMPAIGRNELVRRLIKAMPRQTLVGMRNHHFLEPGIVESAPFESCGQVTAIAPVPI